MRPVELGPLAEIAEDATGLWRIADVRDPAIASLFRPAGPTGLSRGSTHSAYWLRAELHSALGQPSEWLVTLPAARMDELAVFVAEARPNAPAQAVAPIDNTSATFRIGVAAGESKQLYLRVASKSQPLFVPIQLARSGDLAADVVSDEIGLGVLLGAMLYLLMTVAATAQRHRAVLVASLFVFELGVAVDLLCEYEIDIPWLWARGSLPAKAAQHLGVVLITVGALALCRVTLATRTATARACNWLWLPAGVCAAAASVACVAPSIAMTAQVASLMTAVGMIVSTAAQRQLGGSAGWLLLLATAGVAAGRVVEIARMMAWLPATGDPHVLPVATSMLAVLPLALVSARDQIVTLRRLASETAERLRAEQQLAVDRRDSERAVLDNAPDALLLVDQSGVIRHANKAAAALFGYTVGQLEGQLAEVLVPDALSSGHQKLRTGRAENSTNVPMFGRPDLHARRQNGENFAAQIVLAPQFGDDGNSWLVSVRDVSAQRQAEAELAYQRVLLQQVLDSLNVGVTAVDLNGRYLLANRAWRALVPQAKTDQPVGQHIDDVLGEGFAQRMWAMYGKPVIEEGRSVHGELDVEIAGETRTAAATVTPLRDVSGKIIGVCRTSADVTPARQMIRDLAKAKEDAEAANLAKSRFVASVTHELRTPLNAVIGFADVLTRALHDGQHQRYAASIASSGRSLLALVNDLLDLARIEAGKVELRPEPTNLRALVRDVESLFASRAAEKRLRLVAHIDCDVPVALLVDPARLRQVLVNLVGNAVKFTDAGEVRIDVRGQRVASGGEFDLEVAVRDTGIGIDRESQVRIFEEFEQARDQRANTRGGTGLGLAITRKLLQHMGGRIALQSDLGAGSVFTATVPGLPMAEIVAAAAEPPLEAPLRFEPVPVLLATADTVRGDLLAAFLEQSGLRVQRAHDARACHAQAKAELPALVLADADLLTADGQKLATLLVQLAGSRALAVVALAGTDDGAEDLKLSGLVAQVIAQQAAPVELLRQLARYLPARTPRRASRHIAAFAVTSQLLPAQTSAAMAALADKFAAVRDAWQQATRGRDLEAIAALARRMAKWGETLDHAELAALARRAAECADEFALDDLDACVARIGDLMDQAAKTRLRSAP